MIKYISILRGINVGGRRRILMADLKEIYVRLGFSNVVTYIQSGNVVFESEGKRNERTIVAEIKEAIDKAYSFDVPVILRTVENLRQAISQNPFSLEGDVAVERLHLTFLADVPSEENLTKINTLAVAPDRFEIYGNNVFVFCTGKYSLSKLTNNFFENKLKVSATTRNWKTVLKLKEIAEI